MANVFQSLQSIFKIPELKRRVLYTLMILIVYRIGGHVPSAGINGQALQFRMSISTYLPEIQRSDRCSRCG